MSQDALPDTGERLVSDRDCQNAAEHLHRYAMTLELARGKDVLDIASGEGYGSNLLARVANGVVGVDIAVEAVQHARETYRKSNLRFLQGTAAAIPLDSRSVDLVVSCETLEHHDKHTEMLVEIKRVLRPDGMLVVSSPDKHWYSEVPGFVNKHHVKELYRDEFWRLRTTHFSQVALVSQELHLGSLAVPESSAAIPLTFYTGDLASIECSKSLPRPRFSICFASDDSLPAIGASFFDAQRALDDLMRHISHLKGRIDAANKVRGEIESSTAYRLGRLFTSPVRWLGRIR